MVIFVLTRVVLAPFNVRWNKWALIFMAVRIKCQLGVIRKYIGIINNYIFVKWIIYRQVFFFSYLINMQIFHQIFIIYKSFIFIVFYAQPILNFCVLISYVTNFFPFFFTNGRLVLFVRISSFCIDQIQFWDEILRKNHSNNYRQKTTKSGWKIWFLLKS